MSVVAYRVREGYGDRPELYCAAHAGGREFRYGTPLRAGDAVPAHDPGSLCEVCRQVPRGLLARGLPARPEPPLVGRELRVGDRVFDVPAVHEIDTGFVTLKCRDRWDMRRLQIVEHGRASRVSWAELRRAAGPDNEDPVLRAIHAELLADARRLAGRHGALRYGWTWSGYETGPRWATRDEAWNDLASARRLISTEATANTVASGRPGRVEPGLLTPVQYDPDQWEEQP